MSTKSSTRVLPVLHTEYDPPFDPGIDCSVSPSLTQQCFRDECDVNNILKRFQDTGFADFPTDGSSNFLDVASAVDYHTAQNLISQANEVFMELPLKVRRRFNNDPAAFLTFIDDPANTEEARSLGLLEPKAASEGADGAPPKAGADAPASGSPIAS